MTTTSTLDDGAILQIFEQLVTRATAAAGAIDAATLGSARQALDDLAEILTQRLPDPRAEHWTVTAQALSRAMGAPDLPLGLTQALASASTDDRAALLRLARAAGAAEQRCCIGRSVAYSHGAARLTFAPDGAVMLDLDRATIELSGREIVAMLDLARLLKEPAIEAAIGQAADAAEEERVEKQTKGGRK